MTTQHTKANDRDFVKVNALGESFWIEVLHFDGHDVIGRVDNELLCTDLHGYKLDDVIRCRPTVRRARGQAVTVLEPLRKEGH